ncbi:MAG: hypothetical protein KJ955_05210 [Nanoarchaeota archaeon]|nr:hypothetical protein [Nanoarchaeota archaeon]
MSKFEGEQGVDYCESRGWHFAAARLAEKLGTGDMQRRAAGYYIEAKKFVSAARVLTQIGDRNRAHTAYMAAVKESMDKGDFASAARIERELGNEAAAQQLYARAIEESAKGDEHWRTAKLAEEAGNKLEARLFKARAIESEEMPKVL